MKNLSLFRKLLNLFCIAILVSHLSGCIYLVVGGVGALGGYVVSPDSVEGLTENDLDLVWEGAIEILSIMGTIQEQYQDGGVIVSNISGATVTVSIIPLSDSTVKVHVKSRKNYLPKVSVAQDVYVKIMHHLNE